MAALPGFSLDGLESAKQDAQLSVFGQDYDYVSQEAGNYTLRACEREGAEQGSRFYFYLITKPGNFPAPPKPGDRVLVPQTDGSSVWYVLLNQEITDGWQVLQFQRKGTA